MLFDLRIGNFSISPSLLAGPPPQKDSEDRKAVPAGFLGVSLVVVLNAYDRKFRRLLGQSSDFVFDNRRSVGSGPICRFCELHRRLVTIHRGRIKFCKRRAFFQVQFGVALAC